MYRYVHTKKTFGRKRKKYMLTYLYKTDGARHKRGLHNFLFH